MRKDFYVFRQGQKCNSELIEYGIEQAKDLAENLVGKGVEMVYLSGV